MKNEIIYRMILLLVCAWGIEASADEPDDSFLLSLERTACYGTCPTYQVTLEPNDTVTFTGTANVEAIGERISSVDSTVTAEILRKVDGSGILELPEGAELRCKARVADVPGMILYYRKGDRSRKVEDTAGCVGNPQLERLRQLGKELDSLLKTRQWIGAPVRSVR